MENGREKKMRVYAIPRSYYYVLNSNVYTLPHVDEIRVLRTDSYDEITVIGNRRYESKGGGPGSGARYVTEDRSNIRQ